MKLLIRNLARTTTEEEILTLFKAHGIVEFCNLVIDEKTGESKGFGFVGMPKKGEARVAVKSLNGTEVGGSKIRVKPAVNKAE